MGRAFFVRLIERGVVGEFDVAEFEVVVVDAVMFAEDVVDVECLLPLFLGVELVAAGFEVFVDLVGAEGGMVEFDFTEVEDVWWYHFGDLKDKKRVIVGD